MNPGTKEMSSTSSITSAKDIMQRVEALDWNHISQALDSHGNAIIENLISSNECDALVNLYSEDNIFRSRVVMEQYGFGRGEYKYFNYPLPDIIASLRTLIYQHDNCIECKKEYREMKGIGQSTLSNENDQCDKATRVHSNIEKYKEFSEERAKKLYEELLVQYLKSGHNEIEASEKAKSIIRKQCSMRGITVWNWV